MADVAVTAPSAGRLLVIGGGIAGLGAALACARARPDVTVILLERAPAFAEVGAGIQLGPNAVRVLHDWGLAEPLAAVAAFPQRLCVRAARDGAVLGGLTLGERAQRRYGAPYTTIHRADLQGVLLDAVRELPAVALYTDAEIVTHAEDRQGVIVTTADGRRWHGDALLAADGVWSRTRERVLADGRATFSGHVAYRGLLPMADAPAAVRQTPQVVAWLGPRLHAVHYPVRGGAWLNVVVVVEGPLPPTGAEGWDHAAQVAQLRAALGPLHAVLDAVVRAVPQWRLWPLYVREPMRGAHEHGRGRVALLGDAAHPTRPYLAQGAAMALEDAWTLGRLLRAQPGAPEWAGWLARWADCRWARNARVQARSRRNGTLFHATGPLRWGRDAAMAWLGERLLDQPWLYGGPPDPLATVP